MSILDNTAIDVKHIGMTGLICPGIKHISGGRLELFAKNISQPRIPKHGDFPDVFTGFESIFADYTFDSTRRDNDVRVIAIVDKYAMKISGIPAGSNPMRTVIFRDLKTGEVSYFNIRRYSSHTNDYGYQNDMKMNLQVDDVISPDQEIYSSPAKDGDIYKIGVNANVAFMTMLETTEDCFAMSQSLAERLTPTSVETKNIPINLKRYPLNLYGDDEQYKIIPDIGDIVNADGILCAFRPVKRFSVISDLTPDKLTQVNHLFDQKVYAHPGAKVIDIDIHLDSRRILPSRIYDQIKIYHDAKLTYWREIVAVYDKVKNLPISHKFNTLVTRAMGQLLAARQAVPLVGRRNDVTLVDKFNPVTLSIEITLANEVIVNNGHKSAGREGAKGVILVIPDEEMPVDAQGFRADICIDPISVLKRTNIIQLYEHYINRVLKWQAMNLDQLGSLDNQFKRIVEVLNDINPEYAKIIVAENRTPQQIEEYVNDCKRDTIKICIPPGLNTLTAEMVLDLEQKYQTPISPVEFTIMTSNGKKRVTTKEPVCIGSKYVYLLSKYPKPLAPGFGFVNRCHMPVGSKDKYGAPLGTTPIRFGESESRIFAAAMDIKDVLRLKCLFSGSRLGPKAMIEGLMDSPNPATLGRVDISTEKLYDENPSIRIATHMFNTCGISLEHSLISSAEAEQIFDELKELK